MSTAADTEPQGVGLLERERELEEVDCLLAEAQAGSGRALVVRGPPGIGKSSLLEDARAKAVAKGFLVLFAQGAELEQGLAFGVARALVEQEWPGAREILSGRRASDPDELSVSQGLYRLLERHVEDRPVLLAVDDAQWADEPSLRWLAFCVRRLSRLPVAVLMAVRSGEAGSAEPIIDVISSASVTTELQPGPLSEGAIAMMVRGRLDAQADQEFCLACWEATGGNPFYLTELLHAAMDSGINATGTDAARVRSLSAPAITRSVVLRLGRLGPVARRVAGAVAVLGGASPLHLVAALAEVEAKDAAMVADELAAAGILASGRPVDFVHPVVRSAVYADMPDGQRASAHHAAARLLAQEGASIESVASHLLRSEPLGDAWTVDVLHEAAEHSLAPESAIAYLQRALEEPPRPAQRTELLLLLGCQEARQFSPKAIDRLEAVRVRAEDPLVRAEASLPLAALLITHGRLEDAESLLREAIAELAGDERPRGRELELLLRGELIRIVPCEISASLPLAEKPANDGERHLLGTIAYYAPNVGLTADEVGRLAETALAGSRPAIDAYSRLQPIVALEFADRLQEAERHAQAELEAALVAGSPTQEAIARAFTAVERMRQGRLEEAAEAAHPALELGRELGIGWQIPVVGAVLATVALEQGHPDSATRLLDETDPARSGLSGSTSSTDAMHELVRGRVKLTDHQAAAALEHFRHAGALMALDHHDHPGYYQWRCHAALAQLALDNPTDAARLADEELARAGPYAAAGPLAEAQRVAGLVHEDCEQLRQAAHIAERSPATLVRARCLADVGSMLRREGKRTEAREFLLRALEIADQCKAGALSERIRDELPTVGAKPRRSALSGPDSLTPAQRRVAELAATGLTNRQIAQELFVTAKTVEHHMAAVLSKLDIGSRDEISNALGPKH